MIRRPPRSTQSRSSAASDVYKRQSTLCVGEAVWLDCDWSGAGWSCAGSFFFLPKPPNPPSLLAIAEVALCLATSPALGIAGPFDAGKGASEAAGRGSPFAVDPMRITCITGTPLSFDISFTISAMPSAEPGCIAAVSYTHLRAHETRHDLVCR